MIVYVIENKVQEKSTKLSAAAKKLLENTFEGQNPEAVLELFKQELRGKKD